MAKVGRPKWIPGKKQMGDVYEWARVGLTNQNIAAALGIGERTLYDRFEEYPQFLQRIKDGRAKGVSEIASSLVRDAKKGNTTAQIFWLKARAQWKDSPQRVEISGPDGGPIQTEIKNMSDDDLDRVIASSGLLEKDGEESTKT